MTDTLNPADAAGAASALTEDRLRRYLEARHGAAVRMLSVARLGDAPSRNALKGYGYGVPLKVVYDVDDRRMTVVLETITPGPFGHEHMSDRAQALLWSHRAFNALPRHVRSIDVGGFRADGSLVSVGDVEEFFLLNEFVDGEGYNGDLERLRAGGALRDLDIARADALCDYLADIHRVWGPDQSLYVRRIRELVGHNECIMGILDSYPARADGISAARLEAIERTCVQWRWRLKERTNRLRQVHGDFHPWNILFREGVDFSLLDRSRGQWGEPADDMASLTMNYLFFALQKHERFEGDLAFLFTRTWQRYLHATRDTGMLEVVAPFFAFRGLVMASPLWYPNLSPAVREKLLVFVETVLAAPRFDPARVAEHCRG